MLCKRIIAVLTLNYGILTRTKRFKPDYRYTKTQIDLWDVDEVVILDVTREGDPDFLKHAAEIADEAFVPVAMGGGIRSVDDAKRFLAAGADKIVLSTAVIRDHHLLDVLARKLGSQSIVLALDVARGVVFSQCGRKETELSPRRWATEAVALGVGEILLQPIDKDGSLMGYDQGLLKEISGSVSVPVIINGGAGSWVHFKEGFEAGADACATQNIYHFTPTGIKGIKSKLKEAGVNVRL